VVRLLLRVSRMKKKHVFDAPMVLKISSADYDAMMAPRPVRPPPEEWVPTVIADDFGEDPGDMTIATEKGDAGLIAICLKKRRKINGS
jgi:hypothetical protein